MKRFLIVDGNSIMNRAFYGIRLLSNAEGLYTNAIYGFLNIFYKHMDALTPDYAAVAFDLKAPTFRHKRYEAYKANRKGMPEELACQMPVIKEILRAMGIAVLEKEGFEADDIIGTVARLCDEAGTECCIVTGDKDDLQLASDTTKVYLTVTARGTTTTDVFDKNAVIGKYGVTPTEFIDVKGLMGDTSDNIPGVAGIGEKTAFSLIASYKSIDGLYEALKTAEIGKAVRERLENGRDMAYLSRELATIDRFVPLAETLSDCAVGESDDEALSALYTRLGFQSFLSRIRVKPAADVKAAVEITDEEELKNRLNALSVFFYIRYEEPYAMAFLSGDDVVLTRLPIEHFRAVFENEAIAKCTHGMKDDVVFLKEAGISCRGCDFDTELAAYILDPGIQNYTLARLCGTYLNRPLTAEDASGAAEAVSAVALLYRELSGKLKENGQEALLSDIELPLLFVLADMQEKGFTVDRERLRAYGEELSVRIDSLRDSVMFMAGEDFNINSPKQLGTVLFEHLGLPAVKKTKTGYSTDAEVLGELAESYPIVESVLEYRKLAKLKGTYVDGLLPLCEKDGKLHSTFRQTGTVTGRLSSSEPNLQNIPVRMEEGRKLRKMFTGEDDAHVLVDADYSQIELRVLAHLSGDEAMTDAFLRGTDIHRRTASQVFGVPEDAVTDDMRRRAKAVNFGIVYGISDFGLARDLGITKKEASRYIEAYFATYPKVREFMEKTVADAAKNGYVTTMFARRRYLPELASKNYNLRSFGERAAMNTPVQGTAADIIKIAMVRVSDALKNETEGCQLLLQVHDELIVSAPKAEVSAAETILKREMEEAVRLTVPLIAEVGTGFSWYDAK